LKCVFYIFNQVSLTKTGSHKTQQIMSFNGTEGDSISLEDAAAMTEEFRSENEGATKGHFFGIDILNKILTQRSCRGIRFYNGINSSGDYTIIAVGAESNEDDMIGDGDTIADFSTPCPPACGTANDLNS